MHKVGKYYKKFFKLLKVKEKKFIF